MNCRTCTGCYQCLQRFQYRRIVRKFNSFVSEKSRFPNFEFDSRTGQSYVAPEAMAEVPSTPDGGVPPKPAEAKVQPKKETVRIALPPKPTASPTIKLPSLPAASPGAAPPPVAAPSVGVPQAPTAAPSAAAPRAPTASAPGARLSNAPAAKSSATAAAPAAAGAKKTAAPAAAQKPAVSRPPATVGVFDKVLAIVAFVVSGVALGTVLFLMDMLSKTQAMLDEIPK